MAQDDPEPFRDFDRRLRSARGGTGAEDGGEQRRGPYGPGMQAGIDVVAGVVGGGLVGWALDAWLDTAPVLLMVFVILGSAAGLRNAVRTLRSLASDEEGDGR